MSDVQPANPNPCDACPWRLDNQGQPHPHGFYTKRNLARLWAGLRRGERMTCHPTDSRMAEFEGYEKLADRETANECVGALIIVQRELHRFQEECLAAEAEGRKDALARYRRRPGAMTREGLAEIAAAIMFAGTPLGGLKMRTPNLNDLAVGYEPLGEWAPITGQEVST